MHCWRKLPSVLSVGSIALIACTTPARQPAVPAPARQPVVATPAKANPALESVSALFGDGDADNDRVTDFVDACPNELEDGRPPDPADGCPGLPDTDNDGLVDVLDKCPSAAEDKDGVSDEDGCPEDDFDEDGIADASDACPERYGVPNPSPTRNGCEAPASNVTAECSGCVITMVIYFAPGEARIQPSSYPTLNAIAQRWKNGPVTSGMDIIVQGHADGGSEKDNETLSSSRAKNVLQYLTRRGVDTSHFFTKAYGSKAPVEDNSTREGRARNRRVDFGVVKYPEPDTSTVN